MPEERAVATYPYRYAAEEYTRPETYRATRAPVEYALTLIPDAYTSPEYYAVEQERVFAAGWVAVACTSQLAKPGDILPVEVAGQPLFLTRDLDGQLQGFYNVCRHRGAQLITESCSVGRFVRCPYHSWAYDLKGACLGTPLFEGSAIPADMQGIFDMGGVKQFDKADYGLLPVRVASWGFLIFVNLDPEAMPLMTWLGDLEARMGGYRLDEWQITHEKRFDIKANWKLVAENFMEYYHLPWVHPELVKVSRMEDHHRYQGPGMYVGFTTSPIATDERSGFTSLPPLATLQGSDAYSARFYWLFPNIAVSVLPNHAFLLMLQPDGPSHTVERAILLAHPESRGLPGGEETLDQIMGFWDEVNREDIGIVERVQSGLRARPYDGGRMCYRFEETIHRFQNMAIDRMIGVERIPAGDA